MIIWNIDGTFSATVKHKLLPDSSPLLLFFGVWLILWSKSYILLNTSALELIVKFAFGRVIVLIAMDKNIKKCTERNLSQSFLSYSSHNHILIIPHFTQVLILKEK